jgi:transcriptional regulator with XRE-family HTH domain
MVSAPQIRAARSLLGWTAQDLAERAGVHRNTVVRVETGAVKHGHTTDRVIEALRRAGIEFTDATKPGVRMGRRIER